MMDADVEIADLWNRIENLERKLEVTRWNLTITIISVIIVGSKTLFF